MCGIVGYIGPSPAQPIVLDGLSRLEYRGYDSAGMASMDKGAIHLRKAAGRLEHLTRELEVSPLPGCTAIGHTRWATHGSPTEANAHPHMDGQGRFALVHNGIIENHGELRAMLEQKGYAFRNETDTECIVHLIAHLWDGSMLTTLQAALPQLRGSYAIAVLCTDDPGAIFCARKDSPLVVGLGHGQQFLASDIPALLPHTREVDFLQNGEIGILRRDTVEIYTAAGNRRPLAPVHVDWDLAAAEKDGYQHFMLKEIHEEPDALHRTLAAWQGLPIRADELNAITIVACGTAYHAGGIGKYAIEQLARIPVAVDVASEFRYRSPILGERHLFLAISQSGETADTLAALREARSLGACTMGLTNVVGSTLARETAPHTLFTHAGPEIAVASTKAYITQVESLLLMAIHLGEQRGTLPACEAAALFRELRRIPALARQLLESSDAIASFAGEQCGQKQVFFMGRGMDYALALESSLKLKEVSYIMSEAYAAGELKHGTIALIEEGTLVCALMTQPHLAEKTLSNIREVKARGATVLVICQQHMQPMAEAAADHVWTIPDTHALLAPLVAAIPLQLLAYHMALCRGCDVDKPRNLAKSVTVE